MAYLQYDAGYRLYLGKSGSSAQHTTPFGTINLGTGEQWFSLRTMLAAQASLVTQGGVGEATFTLADPQYTIQTDVQPHAMNVLSLWTVNRFGQWGPCWAGYADTVHYIADPEQGSVVEMTCTSPMKLWEITSQTAGDVQTIAQAATQNVAASQVLNYSADAVGYPKGAARMIDPIVDSGSGYWANIPAAVFVNPSQQKWAAVMQSFLANSGLEWFFDETGACHWRPVGYLGATTLTGTRGVSPNLVNTFGQPPTLQLDEMLHADLSETDQSVVTYVEVRFGYTTLRSQAAVWNAPAGMKTHLRERQLIVPAPWLQNKAAAQYLATALGNMYASNTLVGSVTIPADPGIGIGTLVQIPRPNGSGQLTTYYVAAVTYNLQWGGMWAMTLGLTFGRAAGQSFPYVGSVAYPVVSNDVLAGLPQDITIQPALTYAANNPAKITNGWTVHKGAAMKPNQLAVNPAYIPSGTVVTLKTLDGKTIGATPNGEYVTQAKTANGTVVPFTLDLYVSDLTNLGSDSLGYLSVRQATSADSTATSGTGSTSSVTTQTTRTGTYNNATTSTTTSKAPSGNSIAVRAMLAAKALVGKPYILNHAGPDGWDCSGIVAWGYYGVGVPNLIYINGSRDGTYNTDIGPQNIYTFFKRNGAKDIPVSQTQPGDLIFIRDEDANHKQVIVGGYPDGQNGFSHVAFVWSAGGFNGGQNLAGISNSAGIKITDTQQGTGQGDDWGYNFNYALDMSQVPDHPK